MVNVLEKLQYGFAALILLITLLIYLLGGGFETRSLDTLPRVEVETKETIEVAPRPAQNTAHAATRPTAPTPQELQHRALSDKLIEQGVSSNVARRIERKSHKIPRPVFDYASKARNWVPELNKARSREVRTANGQILREVYDIEPGSMLEKLGVQNGDVLVLINEGIEDVSNGADMSRFVSKARDWIDDLRAGRQISITVLRNGRPVQLEFGL